MLWYKFWLETRWRFFIGLGLLVCSGVISVLQYPSVLRLLPLADRMDFGGGFIGQKVALAIELTRTYDGYIWSHWYQQNFLQLWTLFAILIGTGGLVSRRGGQALFTLSLPFSREFVLATRVATGLAELAILSYVPALLVPMLSPVIGRTYSFGDALVYSTCVFAAGAVFFCGAILLSTEFSDTWRPLLIAIGVAMAMSLWEQVSADGARFGVFHVMSAETYFRGNGIPWIGVVASLMVSALFLYRASINFERRDF